MEPIEEFEQHLKMAFNSAARLAEQYQDDDPSGVGRALRSYTLPNLCLWIQGNGQAGNLEHLKQLIDNKNV
jgi:hypothetical protein